MLKQWDSLPEFMRTPEVRRYYDILASKQSTLLLKRVFDIVVAMIFLAFLAIPMVLIAVVIKLDSPGPVFYRQDRITTYGQRFKIHKFRTMVQDADKCGPSVTTAEDNRITRVGRALRAVRLDETPQLLDVIFHKMTFVGARPEVEKYVNQYTPEMMATLLMPAGITSEASIKFRDEDSLMRDKNTADQVYVNTILPEKMKLNLEYIRNFTFFGDIRIMLLTVAAVVGFGKRDTEVPGERKAHEYSVH